MASNGMARSLLMACVVTCGMVLIAGIVYADPACWSTEEGGNGHYYEAIATPSGCDWEQALDGAASRTWHGQQGYLATITSAEENFWIWQTFGPLNEYRLGGYQLPGSNEPAEGWTWLTGEPWDYENWLPPNPDDGGNFGNECTLGFHNVTTDGQWNDRATVCLCHGYVVEFEQGAVAADPATWTSIKALFENCE